MTIQANIKEVTEKLQTDIEVNGAEGGDFSREVVTKAVNAILGEKEDYIKYMELFAKTPDELARLIPTDGSDNDPVKRKARAYLVSNAVCAPATATGLIENVHDFLDA